MSGPDPHPPQDPQAETSRPPLPGQARTRLPFESDDAIRQARGSGFAVLYALGAIALVALAGYMAFMQKIAATDPRVWAPIAVAVWFGVRAVMVRARGGG